MSIWEWSTTKQPSLNYCERPWQLIFLFNIHPYEITCSLQGTDFSRSVESKLPIIGANINSEIDFIKQFTVVLHRELQRRMPFKYLVLKLFDQFNYSLEFAPEIPENHMEMLSCLARSHTATPPDGGWEEYDRLKPAASHASSDVVDKAGFLVQL
jgi:hypothetical protein